MGIEDMDNHLWWIDSGRYFGYSEESIKMFIANSYPTGFPRNDNFFTGSGFIPTPEELENPQKTIEEINKRRFCPTPFTWNGNNK